MPWSPLQAPPPDEPALSAPVHLTVDDEAFEITTSPELPGTYHYAWTTGPNPDYGFTSSRSDGQPSGTEEHETAIRNFLAQVDPTTGYID